MSNVALVHTVDSRLDISQPVAQSVESVSTNVSYTPYPADQFTGGEIGFNINIADVNQYLARNAFITYYIEADFTGSDQGGPLLQIGSGFTAPRAFPMSSCITNTTITVGNQSWSESTNQVLQPKLRMLSKDSLNCIASQCPSMLDEYQLYNDSVSLGDAKNPLASYGSNFDATPRGGWELVVLQNTNTSAKVRFQSTEPLLMSPFGNPNHFDHKALVGIQNIKLTQSYSLSGARVWSHSSGGRTFSTISYSLYDKPVLRLAVMNPNTMLLNDLYRGVDAIHYKGSEVQTFNTTTSGTVAAGASTTLSSNTISLQSVPDLLIVYANKPLSVQDYKDSDVYMGLEQLTLSYRGSQFLSSASPQQLYAISVKNGLKMSYASWSRYAGSIVVLSPRDFGLNDTTQVSGLNTQVNVQITATFKNLSSASLASVSLNLITVQDSVFTMVNGTFNKVVGGLNIVDVVRALGEPAQPGSAVDILGGGLLGGSFFGKLGRVFSDGYKKVLKPAAQLVGSEVLNPLIKQGADLARSAAVGAVRAGIPMLMGAGTVDKEEMKNDISRFIKRTKKNSIELEEV